MYLATSPFSALSEWLVGDEAAAVDEFQKDYGYNNDSGIFERDFREADGQEYDEDILLGREGETQVVYYNQLDERWADEPYGQDKIGTHGCGPTSMSIVVSTLTGTNVDPVEMAQWSYENGYYCPGGGSYHSLIPKAAEHWGLSVDMNLDGENVADALAEGKLVVAIMSKGHFTRWEKMILYLSSQQHTNLLDFLAEKEDALPIKKMTGNFMLKQFVIYDMRNFSHCTELVLDRIAFGDEDRDFAQAIEEFLTMYNARITVICEGLKESNPLCRALLDAGVGNIVTDVEIRGMQEEIMQSLSSQGMTRYAPKEQKKTERKGECYRFMADGVRIAMISSQSRIGTTTMALGFTAWLGNAGASVAYVEKNASGIIPYLSDAYEMDEEAGGYRLEKMWYGTQTPHGGFHFLLEDYGTGRPDADADILLLVCGTKPYEIVHTMKLLEMYETKAAFVLCPFVESALQNTYVEAFQTDYHKVFFLEYQPDCMNGSPNAKIFKNIIERYIAGE